MTDATDGPLTPPTLLPSVAEANGSSCRRHPRRQATGAVAYVSADASITVIGSYVGTVKKVFQCLEEIYDQKRHKSLPRVGNFNCSVICSIEIKMENNNSGRKPTKKGVDYMPYE